MKQGIISRKQGQIYEKFDKFAYNTRKNLNIVAVYGRITWQNIHLSKRLTAAN